VDWYERGTVYFSEVGFVLGTDAGDVLVEGGLGEITLGRVAASPEVRVVVDSDRVDWLSSWRRGLFLERIPARLYRWHTGDDLEDARLVVEGYLGDVAVADPTARDRLSAVLRPLDLVTGDLLPSLTVTIASIPRLSFIVDGDTTADGPSLGASRPEVVGRPGYPTGQPAIPALGPRTDPDRRHDRRLQEPRVAPLRSYSPGCELPPLGRDRLRRLGRRGHRSDPGRAGAHLLRRGRHR
jgi:hypothetical protein